MDEPDFSKYSKEQLQQILRRVDAARFPERVREIEMRLVDIAAADAPGDIHLTTAAMPPEVAAIAGFWRRLAAFLIDMLILGIIGVVLGAILYRQFSALGAWGRLLGFVVTLIYFGVTESRLGGGQSLGMRAMGLRIVSSNGEAIGVPAAFLRAGIFCLAYFLNGAGIDFGAINEWAAMGVSTLTFGLIFSVFYLLVFNRRTRQSIHDLAVGAFVVKAGPGELSFGTVPVWRGHAVVVGVAMLALVAGGLILSKNMTKEAGIGALMQAHQAISQLPGVDRVGIYMNTSNLVGTESTHRLLINAVVDASADEPEVIAQRMAQLALKSVPEASSQKEIVVTLVSGYDIGIASSWKSTMYVHTPEEWRALR